MYALRLFLLSAMVLVCGCSAKSEIPLYEYDAGGVLLWKPCSRAQADVLAGSGKDTDILQSAACSAWLMGSGGVKSADYAKSSQDMIRKYIKKNPQSGLAHYLLAYLVAKEAQFAPLRGLDLVPVIKQEALLAAKLSPEVDFAGPDRMLGELYLKAPSPPLSIGNLGTALEYYEKAVKEAPDFALNHFGLASALLEDDELKSACVQYEKGLQSKSFDKKLLKIEIWKKLAGSCGQPSTVEK